MTAIDVEIAALRQRRRRLSISAWLRTLRPFDRRSIRVPAERDAYWKRVQLRLAESDAASIIGSRSTTRPQGSSTPSAFLDG